MAEKKYIDTSQVIRYLIVRKREYYGITLDGIIKALEEIPAADVAPVVHAEWVEGKSLEKCSVCGKKGFPDWHYCPNCGAKMDGERKEDTP